MTDAALTLQQAADELGVHYMTVYRYVRLGSLPATKVGGSWLVDAADLRTFREGAASVDDGVGRRRAPWATRLESRLVAGDARGAWTVIESALAGGAGLEEIYLDVIAPAMRGIGERWASGEIDVAVEHRATGIAQRLVGRLGPRFARRGRTRGAVVLGTPEHERHALPVAMVADLLRLDGWDVSDLGADLPTASFVAAARATPDLAAVGVSVSATENLVAAGELFAALAAGVPGVARVAGGAAVRDAEHASALGATAWAPSARAFITHLA